MTKRFDIEITSGEALALAFDALPLADTIEARLCIARGAGSLHVNFLCSLDDVYGDLVLNPDQGIVTGRMSKEQTARIADDVGLLLEGTRPSAPQDDFILAYRLELVSSEGVVTEATNGKITIAFVKEETNDADNG